MGLPVQTGYTLRTQHLIEAQRALGMPAEAVIEPSTNLPPSHKIWANGLGVYRARGVSYYRLTEGDRWRRWALQAGKFLRDRQIRGSSRFFPREWLPATPDVRLVDLLLDHLPEITVAHGHTVPGAARMALRFAHRRRIPFVFEVRGFWEMTAATYAGVDRIGEQTLTEWQAETNQLADQAAAVITLGEGMRAELIQRGISADRIHLVENGVDAERFPPAAAKDPELLARLELQDKFVAGYMTSVRRLEGVEVMIRALPLLRDARVPLRFVLVGEGDDLSRLRGMADELGVREMVRFVGRVPHAEVKRYYSLLDAFVVPRLNLPVCRLVTPLKPLEAMCQQIATLVSDLPALTELVENGQRGLAFAPESAEDLAAKLRWLYEQPELRQRLARQGREWVLANRTWRQMAAKTQQIYSALCRPPTSANSPSGCHGITP
jgi:glycosyltransferase involved in cell wall biosynthesis